MDIILKNIHTEKITIQDMGIELNIDESISLLDFIKNDILTSDDLELIYESGYIEFTIDGAVSSFVTVIKTLTGISYYEHENLNTLKHELSESSFFKVEREDNEVSRIIYYTNESLTVKIREEEIIRQDNEVYQIIKRQYENGVVVKTETQTINRIDGEFSSIEVTTA